VDINFTIPGEFLANGVKWYALNFDLFDVKYNQTALAERQGTEGVIPGLVLDPWTPGPEDDITVEWTPVDAGLADDPELHYSMDGAIWQSVDMGYEFEDDFEGTDPIIGDTWHDLNTGMTNVDVERLDGALAINGTHPYLNTWRSRGVKLNRTFDGSFEVSADVLFESGIYRTNYAYFHMRLEDASGNIVDMYTFGYQRWYRMQNNHVYNWLYSPYLYYDGFEPDRYHTWSMRYDESTRTLEGYVDGRLVGKFEYLILEDVTLSMFVHTYYTSKTVKVLIDNFHTTPTVTIPKASLETEMKLQISYKDRDGVISRTVIHPFYVDATSPTVTVPAPAAMGYPGKATTVTTHITDGYSMAGGTLHWMGPDDTTGTVPLAPDTDTQFEKRLLWLKGGAYALPYLQATDWTFDTITATHVDAYHVLRNLDGYGVVIISEAYASTFGLTDPQNRQALMEWVAEGGSLYVMYPPNTVVIDDFLGVRFLRDYADGMVVADPDHPIVNYPYPAVTSGWPQTYEVHGYWKDYTSLGYEAVISHPDVPSGAVTMVKEHGQGVIVMDSTYSSYTRYLDTGRWLVENILSFIQRTKVQNQGASSTAPAVQASDHGINDYFDNIFTYRHPGATALSVHISEMDMEDGYDFIQVLDGRGRWHQTLTGAETDLWTIVVPGDTVHLRVITDGSINSWGFETDLIRHYGAWASEIPALGITGEVSYYVTAWDGAGNVGTSPTYRMDLTEPPVVSNVTFGPDSPSGSDPLSVSAEVMDAVVRDDTDGEWMEGSMTDVSADPVKGLGLKGSVNGTDRYFASDDAGRIFMFEIASDLDVSSSTQVAKFSNRVRDLVAGDFDEDGDVDLVVMNMTDGYLYFVEQTSSWSFADPVKTSTYTGFTGRDTYGLDVGDFNEDGHLDVVGGGYQRNIRLFTGHGNGTFDVSIVGSISYDLTGMACGDLDNDGHMDILVAPLGGNLISFIGQGNGTFVKRTSVVPFMGAGNVGKEIALGDIDGDGNLDIIVHTGSLYVHMGKGDGVNFTFGGNIMAPGSWASLLLEDLDLDGDLDIVLNRYSTRDVLTYLNDGTFMDAPVLTLVDSRVLSSSYLFGLARATDMHDTTGTVVSRVHDMGGAVSWDQVQVEHASLGGQTVELEVRTSTDNITWSSWATALGGSVGGKGPLTSGVFPSTPTARYVQWRLTLGDDGLVTTPYVRSVTLLGTSTDPTVELRWRPSEAPEMAPWSTASMVKVSRGRFNGTVPAEPVGPVGYIDLVVVASMSGGVEGTSSALAYRDFSGPIIVRANPVPYYSNTSTAVRVVANVDDLSGVANATLHYSYDNSTWSSTAMTLGNDRFTDMDGDADMELAVSVATSSSVFFLDDDLSTNASVTGIGSGTHKPMVAGDIDGDGVAELVVGDPSSNAPAFWVLEYNSATGQYEVVYTHTPATQVPVYCLEVGDVDGDGSVEILRGQQDHQCVVSSWDGTKFVDEHTFFLAYNPYMVRVMDWDGDGQVEVITADRTTEARVRVYSWTGSSFAAEYVSPDLGEPLYGFAMADMDGDGGLEMVVSMENYYASYWGVMYMLKSTGPDRYSIMWRGGYAGRYVYLQDAADWDGDGRMEVAVGSYDFNSYPRGTFAVTYEWDPETTTLVEDWVSRALPSGYSGRARFLDLEDDGDLELVVPHQNGYVFGFSPDDRDWVMLSSDMGNYAGSLYPGAITPLGGPDAWSAVVPAPGSETQIWYYIVATDASGMTTTSTTHFYYADGTAPTIDNVTAPPTYLRTQDPFQVYCNVTDSVSIGGAVLEYNVTGGSWVPLAMTRISSAGTTSQFLATIPDIGSATTVTYRVVARDIAGNSRTSSTQSYVVDPGPVFNWMKDGFGSPFKWELNITDNGAVSSVTITYSTDRVTWYNATVTNNGNIYSASADLDANSTVYFEVTATDNLGLVNSFRGRSGASNVTMLVADPTALTAEEQGVYQVFHDRYYTMSLLDDAHASVANLTTSDLVLVVDYGRISTSLVNDLIDDGVAVILLNDGMRSVAPTGWYQHTNTDYRSLAVIRDEEPFRAYYRMSTLIQTGGYGGRITNVPAGWTLVGSIRSTNYESVIKKENTTAGGKAITFPYDIRYLSDRGWYFFDQLLNWTMGESLDGPMNATAGRVILVINNDDWTLNARDARLDTLLKDWGYSVQRLRIKDVFRFNATNATAVVVPAYYTAYGDQGALWDRFMDQGVPVILLRDSLYTFRTTNRAGGTGEYHNARVFKDEWFVTGFNNTRFWRQNAGYAYTFYNAGPTGWTALARHGTYNNYYNMWYKQTPSGVLGFAEMSDPQYYMPDGEFLLLRMLQNATGTAMPGGLTATADTVVMVIVGGQGGSDPVLTAQEAVVADMLTSWGHTIYYLPQRNMSRTNVSAAKAVVATHWVDRNTASKTFFDAALADGVGVVLCYDAGRTYGGSWHYSTSWEMRFARPSNTTTIFRDHASVNHYFMNSGTGVRVTQTSPGWTFLAGSGNSYYSTWQQKPGTNGSFGFIFGVNPYYINLNGRYFLELAVNYSMGLGLPARTVVPTDDVVFITSGEDADGPIINSHEAPVVTELARWGYNVTYVFQRDVLTVDWTNASMVVAADWIRSFRAWDTVLDGAMNSDIGVVLLYRGSSAYQASWGSYDQWQRRLYYVESPTAFYEGMSGYSFYAQRSGVGHYWGNTVTGFTRIGDDYYNSGVAFYKGGTADAHVCVLTADPALMDPIRLMERLFNFSQNISIAPIPTSADVVLLVAHYNAYDPVPNVRESFLRRMLEDMGLTVEVRSWLEARRYDYSSSRLLVYTQNLPIGTDVHTKVIDMGLGLALFADAGKSAGGSWGDNWGDWTNWWVLTASPGGGFLEGYKPLSIQILDERQTIFRSTNTPPGWNFGGYAYYNSGYRTVHWRENVTSGGHGGIMAYDPNNLNENGQRIARAMIDWCLYGSVGMSAVPEATAVLVIRSNDHLTPTLNTVEGAARDLLIASGLEVTYLPVAHIGTTDLSNAAGVFLAEGITHPTMVSTWVSQGLRVGLMYTGSDDLGGSWTWHNNANSRMYAATGDTGFNHMFTDTRYTIQNTGSAFAMYTNHPAGLVRGGHGYYAHYWTGGHREDATSGGRVGFLTYDPRDLTMAGQALYANLISWVTGRPFPMMNATAGEVAMVINSYDESGATLSTRETALRDNLTGMGLSVDYVSHVNSSRTDFSRSSFVVFCDYAPGRYLVDHLVDDLGKGVGMYYNSAWRHGGSWGWPSGASASTFYVIDNSSFMANYSTTTTVTVGDGTTNHPEVYNYAPSGWTYVGRMTQHSYYRSGFSRENSTTGGRGVIFTYRPDYLTAAGIAVLNETFYYLLGANATMPDGNADLTVTSVAIDATGYSAGDVVTVNATVKNQGTSDVNRSFPVEFMVDGKVIGTVLLTNLSAGASTNVSLNWTVRPGTHVVHVRVDGTGLVPESNEANNGKDLTVANIAGPDLTIEAVSMVPVTREDGNFINVTVTVANVGTVNVTSAIEVMVMNGTRGLGSVLIQGIPKAKNVTVTLFVLGLLATANMTVYADWEDRVAETDETNNTYALAGSIGPPTGQTVQAKKGTWIEIEVTAESWTHVYDAVTVRLFDPEDNNVGTMSYSSSSWGTRTIEYMLDGDGTWRVTAAYAHTAFDYTMRITVVDPTSGL
ncbi:MAG: VCBS repeat-containing protein, partial [Thermoplasmata archaeon]